MRPILLLRPALLIGACGTAAFSGVLAVDYTEWLPAATQMATDASGSLYLLANCPASGAASSCVTKLSADGKTMLWQNALGFQATTMAVSPPGEVFVIPILQPSDTALHVAKLGSGGLGIAWTASAGFLPPTAPTMVLAADSQGRTYVSAPSAATSAYDTSSLVVRLNAAGSAIDWTTAVTGWPTSIAADGTGALVVAGYIPGTATLFVTRVASNGSAGYYAQLPNEARPALALDANGNAVIFSGSSGSGVLQRLNSAGIVTASTKVAGGLDTPQLALDSAGNAYLLGQIGQLYAVSNTLATCLPSQSFGSQTGTGAALAGTAPILTVVAPGGSVSQSTYLPGAAVDLNNDHLLLAVRPDSTVFVAATGASAFAPTAQGPFPQAQDNAFLTRLSFTSAAQTVALACVGNAATYLTLPVAPGELVTLTGSGLGPAQGIAPQSASYPTEVSGVRVTFDGTPAPLLWVQDAQINAVVPWSVPPGGNTKICLSLNGATANCLTWPVVQTTPGVFTVDGSYAVALNQDGTMNSATNPAPAGSIVAVWATGLGPVNPPQADGAKVGTPLPANVLQTGVEAWWLNFAPRFTSLIETPLPVTWSGPAPTVVSGISQINFQVPPEDSPVPNTATYYLTVPAGSSGASSTRSQNFMVYVAAPQP